MAKTEKNFLLVSLEEDKAKKLAQVISNETCRKILDFLTKKEATETELSKELNVPLSTVHYNLKQLSESGLVLADEYHYSKKGREINHYSLANKYIIIAPKTTERMPSGIRNLLPVMFIIAAGAAFLKLFMDMAQPIGGIGSASMQALEISSPIAAPIAKDTLTATQSAGLYESAKAAGGAANQTADAAMPQFSQAIASQAPNNLPFVMWFVAGAVFALAVYFLYGWLKEKMQH